MIDIAFICRCRRDTLAVVDELKTCKVYDLQTKALKFTEENANSVAWNTESDDMLCFAGNSQLHIKADSVHLHTQQMQGFVVGFTGSKVFYLNASCVHTMDVPQSALLYRYLDQKQIENAYNVACLGITPADWRLLAWDALKMMDFGIARKAFTRLRDVRYMEAVTMLEEFQKSQFHVFACEEDDPLQSERKKKANMLLQGEILAYQGRFQHAAKLFGDANEPQRAIRLYSELRMWDEAKRFAGDSKLIDVKELAGKQATWAEELQDWRAAAELYVASGNVKRAVEIMGERGWYEDMMHVIQTCDPESDRGIFTCCATYLLQADKFAYAKDLYMKIGDIDAVLRMHIRLGEWEEAIRLVGKHRNCIANLEGVFVPYAEWLIGEDRFEDALDAYTKAQRKDKCIHLLETLVSNAVSEKRYRDASYFHWRLCDQKLMSVEAKSCEGVSCFRCVAVNCADCRVECCRRTSARSMFDRVGDGA